MAIWQYDVYAVPREAIIAAFGVLPKEIQPERFDTHDWWANNNGPDESEVKRILPISSSWSDSIKIWGTSDGNCIELHYDEGHLFEMRIRIDLRESFQEFFDAILELAIGHDYVFVTEESNTLEPTRDTLLGDMMKSQSFSFVRNTSEYLERLNNQRAD